MERQGLLVRDMDNGYLTLKLCDEIAMDPILDSSMICRDARMPRARYVQEQTPTSLRWYPAPRMSLIRYYVLFPPPCF